MLLRGWRGPQWMKRNRRYLGVAAFGYALLHTILYLIDKAALDPVLSDLPKLYIWTGWIAFLIFVPLAITSNNWFIRKMGTWWKWLQRWTYAAAVLTLAHWAALNDWGGIAPALVHFGPLIAWKLTASGTGTCARAPPPDRLFTRRSGAIVMSQSPNAYSRAQIWLHWIVVIGVILQIGFK